MLRRPHHHSVPNSDTPRPTDTADLRGLLRVARSRVRRSRGQAALETVFVFPAWFLTTTLIINLMFMFGGAMLMQSFTDQWALRAGGQGCVYTSESAYYNNNTTYFNQFEGFGQSNLEVQALWYEDPQVAAGTIPVPATTSYDNYYKSSEVNLSTFEDSNGNILPVSGQLQDASCTTSTPVVPRGAWIFVYTSYNQNLWFWGSVHIQRVALTLSEQGLDTSTTGPAAGESGGGS